MLKRIYLGLMMLFWANIFAQDASFYLPYQMPTHSSVKFNTFLANPAFPLLGFQEQNAGLYYRQQWSGFKNDNFNLMGLSYGINWNEISSANAFVYRRNAGIMSNTGIVLNYGHYVQFSDNMGLRLGLNVIPMYSGIDENRVIINAPNDPLLNFKKTFGLTAQPGFDFNFGDLTRSSFHVGVTAENLFDYSFADSKAMTAFADKTFTGHLMYRSMYDSNSSILEDGHWQVMFRATKEQDQLNMTGNVAVDLPRLGWTYLGYTQKYGVFAGVGFHINDILSIGFEYENGAGAKIKQLGHTWGVHINGQFGGDRQKASRLSREKQQAQRQKAREKARQRIESRRTDARKQITPPVVKDTIPKTTPTPPPPKVDKVEEPPKVEPVIRVQNIASDKIPPGHYVVVGVFRDPRNAFRYIQELRKKYQVAGFVHPKTNFTYVYVGGAALSREAAEAIHGKNMFNPDFNTGNIWILHVGN